MRDISPDLMDILGAASALPIGTDGAADDGAAEYVYRFAPLVGIYGGTLEVFRNMIAQYVLGLGKPNYSPPLARKCHDGRGSRRAWSGRNSSISPVTFGARSGRQDGGAAVPGAP